MKLTFESRPAYAVITASGAVDTSEATTLREVAATRARAHETMRLLIDLRDAELSREGRDAILGWARAPHASSSAIITLDELFAAEVNMAALASGARVRGFAGTSDAHRWLTRGSMVKTPYDGGSSRPPPIDAATRRAALFGNAPPRISDRVPGSPRPSDAQRISDRPPAFARPTDPARASERPSPFSRPSESPRPSEPPPAHYPGRVSPTSERPTPVRGIPRAGTPLPEKK